MNRRSLLKLLPTAPLALALPALVPAADGPPPGPLPLDRRPTFRLVDYRVRLIDGRSYPCRSRGGEHDAYTHGCVPLAFSLDVDFGERGGWRPATVDDLPLPVHRGCELGQPGDRPGPHHHHSFRWVQ